jgi:hypothetical protein
MSDTLELPTEEEQETEDDDIQHLCHMEDYNKAKAAGSSVVITACGIYVKMKETTGNGIETIDPKRTQCRPCWDIAILDSSLDAAI